MYDMAVGIGAGSFVKTNMAGEIWKHSGLITLWAHGRLAGIAFSHALVRVANVKTRDIIHFP